MWNRPLQVQRILSSYASVQGETWFKALVTAAVRVKNILSKAGDFPKEVIPLHFREEEERALFATVSGLRPLVEAALKRSAWQEVTELLFKLEPDVTRFFDKVLVMDEDPAVRGNRLSLLDQCNELFKSVGDLGILKE